jgi:hypothetical protein
MPNPRAHSATRPRLPALIGVAAMLFQAILFGWHHHDLAFAGRLAHAVASAPHGSSSPPDIDADGCEICQALHHQTAATPEELFAAAPPPLTDSAQPHDAKFTVGALALAFRSRAPPSADAAITD